MGICLKANGSDIELNMGYGGFHNLRCSVANAIDPELGKLYHQTASILSEESIEAERQMIKLLADENRFPESMHKALDFLFLSDCEGKIDYKGCKQIYDYIKDIDFNGRGFQYVGYKTPKTNDYELFKKFLKECYSHKRTMRWS